MRVLSALNQEGEATVCSIPATPPYETEKGRCNVAECPRDCVWDEWSEWDTCQHSPDGDCVKARSRVQLTAADPGGSCESDEYAQTELCNMAVCAELLDQVTP